MQFLKSFPTKIYRHKKNPKDGTSSFFDEEYFGKKIILISSIVYELGLVTSTHTNIHTHSHTYTHTYIHRFSMRFFVFWTQGVKKNIYKQQNRKFIFSAIQRFLFEKPKQTMVPLGVMLFQAIN